MDNAMPQVCFHLTAANNKRSQLVKSWLLLGGSFFPYCYPYFDSGTDLDAAALNI